MAWRGRRASRGGAVVRALALASALAAAGTARGGERPGPGPVTPRDVLAMEQALTDRALAVPGPTPVVVVDAWRREDGAPGPFAPLAAHLPTPGPDGSVRLPRRWTAQRLRLAGVPRLDADRKDPAPALHALASIAGRPSAASVLRWPELGARREAGGAVLWLVPGLAEDEAAGPPRRAWFLLEYRDGRLVTAVAIDGADLTGVLYVRQAPGGE